METATGSARPTANSERTKSIQRSWQKAPSSYLLAALMVAIMTGIIAGTHADVGLVSVPPIYLLAVQAIAIVLGRRAAIFASILAFFCFDWFFVEPKFQLTASNPYELVALFVFLVTAIVVGQLTAMFRNRERQATKREMEATMLAKASWMVASELDRDIALRRVLAQCDQLVPLLQACLLVPDASLQWQSTFTLHEPATARLDSCITALNAGKLPVGWSEESLDSDDSLKMIRLPVMAEQRLLGVVVLVVPATTSVQDDEKQVIRSLVNHVAMLVQRGQLIEAQTKAQILSEANKLKTALLQMVSHDFRSPLSSIKASVTSLLMEGAGKEGMSNEDSLLQCIDHETDRLNQMIGNLLDLSRLEADAWRPQRERCSLVELIGSTLDAFSAQENERIKVTLPPDPPDLLVDYAQMQQVLRNLLENALKYSPGEVELVVRPSDETVSVDVLDEGGGLPPGDEQAIFEPFYRAPQHQESAVPGIGMGLAVCKALVESNGGRLTAETRQTGGAKFTVHFPLQSKA